MCVLRCVWRTIAGAQSSRFSVWCTSKVECGRYRTWSSRSLHRSPVVSPEPKTHSVSHFFLVFKFRDHSKPHSHTPRRIPRQKFIAKLFAFRKIRKIPKPRRGPSEFFYLADCHRGIIVRFYFVYVYMLYIPLI